MSELDRYVDVSGALKRIGGSMDLYKRLLKQFSGGDHIDPLEEALNNGDFEDASRKVHSLKGVCANLSLIELAAISARLENKVHEGADFSDTFSELKRAYNETSRYISEIL